MKSLCDMIIPVLGVLLFVVAWRQPRPRVVLARVAAALGWVYLLHFVDRWLGMWAGLGLDFSTHTGVALAIGSTLAALGREWVAATMALWCLYAILMVRLGYHTVADIGTTAAAVVPGALLAQLIVRERSTVAE